MKKLIFLLSLSAVFTTVSFALTSAPETVGVVSRVSCPRPQKPMNSAPEAVGEFTRVEGLVTVSQGNTLGNAFKNKVVLQNARVVSTANGSATIMLNNCCVINLKPDEAVTVDRRRECKAILASIQPAGAVGPRVAGGILGNALILGSGVLSGIGFIQAISQPSSNSALQSLSGS